MEDSWSLERARGVWHSEAVDSQKTPADDFRIPWDFSKPKDFSQVRMGVTCQKQRKTPIRKAWEWLMGEKVLDFLHGEGLRTGGVYLGSLEEGKLRQGVVGPPQARRGHWRSGRSSIPTVCSGPQIMCWFWLYGCIMNFTESLLSHVYCSMSLLLVAS